MRLRENQRYYFDKSWVLLRRILLKIGRRFTQEGRLEGMEDVFHLSIEEIRLMSRYSGIPADRRAIAARREAFEREGQEYAALHDQGFPADSCAKGKRTYQL